MKRVVAVWVVVSAFAAGPGLGAQVEHAPGEPAPGLELDTAGLEVPWARLTVKAASPATGIRGRVRGLETSIFFESKVVAGDLRSIIVGPLGEVLYEYSEPADHHREIVLSDGSRLELAEPPRLEVLGVPSAAWAVEGNTSARALATRPEGLLIRQLGVELVARVPGEEWTAERRGLELATQALWPYFDPAGSPRPRVTVDYEINALGYLVTTQPERLVLDLNRLPARVALRHDEDPVGGCFGRCGGGCTGGFAGIDMFWLPPSEWVDTFGPEVPAQQRVRCVSGEDWIDTWYAKWTTHSVSGWVTEGCRIHDECCQSLGGIGCFTVCNLLVPMVSETILAGRTVTWAYSGWTWTWISSYNAGYSGCTCPGHSPFEEYYECTQ